MAVLRELRRQGRQIVVSLLGITMIAYFAYHAVEGERGLRSYIALKHRTAVARESLDDVEERRKALDRRVGLLRPEGLDLDMLEERAHQILGLVREDEVVILLDAHRR